MPYGLAGDFSINILSYFYTTCQFGMNIHQDFTLSEILFYKIGGRAKFVLEARSRDDIIEAFEFIKKNNIQKWFIVGLGSNLLVNDAPFDGAVIWIRGGEKPQCSITQEGLIAVHTGETLDTLIIYAFSQGFAGLESLGGLPSTVGGTIYGNASAFGGELRQSVDSVKLLDNTPGNTQMLTLPNCEFGYR